MRGRPSRAYRYYIVVVTIMSITLKLEDTYVHYMCVGTIRILYLYLHCYQNLLVYENQRNKVINVKIENNRFLSRQADF